MNANIELIENSRRIHGNIKYRNAALNVAPRDFYLVARKTRSAFLKRAIDSPWDLLIDSAAVRSLFSNPSKEILGSTIERKPLLMAQNPICASSAFMSSRIFKGPSDFVFQANRLPSSTGVESFLDSCIRNQFDLLL